MIRVEFDATLDEVADVSVRLVAQTVAFRRQRLRSQVLVGGCFAAALVYSVATHGSDLPAAMIATVGAVAVAGGLLLGYAFGYFHNWHVRRSTRRMVGEMLGGVESLRCEFELRPDVLWCKTTSSEITFPWSRLKRVTEADGSVELWFDPGLAVVRQRAFRSAEERRTFVEAVTELRQRNVV